MVSAKLRSIAQVLGFLSMALLTLYGALALFGGGALPAFARSASAAAVPGEAPNANPNGAPSLDWGGATVPLVLNYQGYLRDAEHNPLSGYYTMTLRVYANVTDPVASALWSEQHVSVTVRSGSFSVLLGNITPVPATLFDTPDRFVGVTVDPYDEMVPRQRFASVPYAFEANQTQDSDLLDGAHANELVPPGTVVAFAGVTAPSGWLLCNGAAVSRSQYPALFTAIGTGHGSGNGSTTFNIPDYRGRFLRGVDGGVGRDPDRAARTAANTGGRAGDAVGSVQGDATKMPVNPFVTGAAGVHTHTYYDIYRMETGGWVDFWDHGGIQGGDNDNKGWDIARESMSAGNHSHTVTGGDIETRPKNANVNWIIKY